MTLHYLYEETVIYNSSANSRLSILHSATHDHQQLILRQPIMHVECTTDTHHKLMHMYNMHILPIGLKHIKVIILAHLKP